MQGYIWKIEEKDDNNSSELIEITATVSKKIYKSFNFLHVGTCEITQRDDMHEPN